MYLNATVRINTTGIKTTTNCTLPKQLGLSLNSSGVHHRVFTISATSVEGCSQNVSFGGYDEPVYGVQTVRNCGTNTSDLAFQPVRQSLSSFSAYMRGLSRTTVQVIFFFMDKSLNGTAAVFCQPTMQLFDVTAFATLNNNSLTNVTIIDKYLKPNNVSGPPLNGVLHNGHVFLHFLLYLPVSL